MARVFSLSLDGVESTFEFKAVDRAAIHGKRRRVALDRQVRPAPSVDVAEEIADVMVVKKLKKG